eukprot:3965604-Amphidinium_carterae.1
MLLALKQDPYALDYAHPELLLVDNFWPHAETYVRHMLVLKVTMLSGRAFLSVWHVHDGDTKGDVLDRCKDALTLPDAKFELMCGNAPLPNGCISRWGLRLGEVNDLQVLILDRRMLDNQSRLARPVNNDKQKRKVLCDQVGYHTHCDTHAHTHASEQACQTLSTFRDEVVVSDQLTNRRDWLRKR